LTASDVTINCADGIDFGMSLDVPAVIASEVAMFGGFA
jgi:hypothetical protein